MSRSAGTSPTSNSFDFEDEVKVLKRSADGRVMPGDIGVIVGKSDEELGEIEYGVFVERLRRVYSFVRADLLPLGPAGPVGSQ